MKLLEKICKELGVEVGEHWLGNDGMKYTIGKTGKIFQFNENGSHIMNDYDRWEDIFTGKLKPAWRPKEGDIYYFPYIDMIEDKRFAFLYWRDTAKDKWYLENGLAFKTKEEAIEVANKMLEAIKEDKNDSI